MIRKNSFVVFSVGIVIVLLLATACSSKKDFAGSSSDALKAMSALMVSANDEMTISNYVLVSKVRTGRTTFDYTYRASVTNNSTENAKNVEASLTSLVSTTTVLAGTLTFGDVAAGSTVASSGTFTVRIDRNLPFNQSNLGWDIQAIFAEAVETVDVNGGVIEVTDPNSTIFGTKIEVPENTLSEAVSFAISEAESIQPPNDYENVSRAIKVDLTGDLNGFVIVSVPLISILSEDDMLIAISFDEQTSQWNEIPILNIDYLNNRVMFLTNHFSTVVIQSYSSIYFVPEDDMTDFNVVEDSLSYDNSYGDGYCFGMANFAIWYLNKYGHGLYCRWDPDTAENVSELAQDTISVLYDHYLFFKSYFPTVVLDQKAIRDNLIYKISIKNIPTVLLMAPLLDYGHAIVVYGYKITSSDMVEFYCYDVNEPREMYIVYCSKSLGRWHFYAPDTESGNYSENIFFYEDYAGDKYDSEFQEIYDEYSDTGSNISCMAAEQTGNWNADNSGGRFISTNWSINANNSWYFNGHAVNISYGTRYGDYAHYYIPVEVTYGTGELRFNYGGKQYTSSVMGNCNLLFVYSYGSLDTTLSSMEITMSGPVNLGSMVTGNSISANITGNITSHNGNDTNPVFGGTISSISTYVWQ